jgi:hypothetical protein
MYLFLAIIPISEKNLREEKYAFNLNNTHNSKIHSPDDNKETVETIFHLLSNLNTDSISNKFIKLKHFR